MTKVNYKITYDLTTITYSGSPDGRPCICVTDTITNSGTPDGRSYVRVQPCRPDVQARSSRYVDLDEIHVGIPVAQLLPNQLAYVANQVGPLGDAARCEIERRQKETLGNRLV